MSATASSYSITMRLHTAPDHGIVGAVATAISAAGGVVTAIDVVDSTRERLVLDVTCSASDEDHSHKLVAAADVIDGVEVYKVSDRTFLLHIGGKIEVQSKVPLRNRDDLSMAYTPGVGRVSMALANNPDDVSRLTIKGNSVAVVTDGSAVLGLGNIGPGAALPVMEGKAALFKRFANIDAWPICLASQDTDEIVRAVEMIAPGFGGINLEDIAAPRCFEIEQRLRQSLDIPVFHDDQHGTAIVVLAALTNALRVVEKSLTECRVVLSGAGAAGTAIVTLLLAAGVTDVVVVDREGALCTGDESLSPAHTELAATTNPRAVRGSLQECLVGADVFIGVSAPGILKPEWIAEMAQQPVVFALANPDPEVDPAEAEKYAAVVASGRSDYPNQINNVLAFPGVFRGLLDARARDITIDMLLRAADAIAHVVHDEELNPNFIIPTVFNAEVPKAVAAAIRGAGNRLMRRAPHGGRVRDRCCCLPAAGLTSRTSTGPRAELSDRSHRSSRSAPPPPRDQPPPWRRPPKPVRASGAAGPAAPKRTRQRDVLAISVDGLSTDALDGLGSDSAFGRLLGEGAATLNARTEVEQTITLPNHAGMFTGRRVDPGEGGHGVTWNDELPGRTVPGPDGHGVGLGLRRRPRRGRDDGPVRGQGQVRHLRPVVAGGDRRVRGRRRRRRTGRRGRLGPHDRAAAVHVPAPRRCRTPPAMRRGGCRRPTSTRSPRPTGCSASCSTPSTRRRGCRSGS